MAALDSCSRRGAPCDGNSPEMSGLGVSLHLRERVPKAAASPTEKGAILTGVGQ